VGASARRWTQLVEPHFSFLQTHAFRPSAADDKSWLETWVEYKSDASAVRVANSREFSRVEVHLIRLVKGVVPAYPIWVTSEPLNWVLLDTIVQARWLTCSSRSLPSAAAGTGNWRGNWRSGRRR
jgi:hypothetical protein